MSSRKHLAVAWTSADALCAAWNFSSNSFSCNSSSVGHLYAPPLPPGNSQKSVDTGIVSTIFLSKRGVSISNLRNSAPIILLSNSKLCPATTSALFNALLNSFKTKLKLCPSFLARSVEIP